MSLKQCSLLGKSFLALLIILSHSTLLHAQNDTVSVFFPFNVSMLSEQTQAQLDSAIYMGKIPASQAIQIIGYADAVGSDTFNLHLSRERAANVKSWLIQSGFQEKDITLVIGKGESAARAKERRGGNRADRHVDIVRSGTASKPLDKVAPMKSKPRTIAVVHSSNPLKASATDISAVPAGETLLLDNIYFYAGRHIVRQESDKALAALVDALKANPDIKIRIEGHVCCVPSSAMDAIDDDTGREELSVNRAAVIRQYLIDHGIDKERLSFTGFGHRHPLVPFERDEDDANRNRRVEIRIMQ
jgi:outer membrane protein OmpA-like peptidoglycan-associated protein